MINAVVIGRNYCSVLGLARAAGAAGCKVGIIKTVKRMPGKFSFERMAPPVKCKYVDKYLFAKEPDQEQVIKVLLKEFSRVDEKTIILPADDFAAETIDTYYDTLKESFILPNVNNKQGEILRLMDKAYQKQLARTVGLPVANGWSIEVKNGEFSIPEDILYPCFCKPETAILNRKKYMGMCQNEQELKTLIEGAAKACDCMMLVEEYVPIEYEYAVNGFASPNQVIIPGVIRSESFGEGSHAGVTEIGRLYTVQPFADVVTKLEIMMQSTGLTGLFDIDLYEANGTIYFNELNVRMGASAFSVFCGGVNLVEFFLQNLGLKPQKVIPERVEKELTFINDKVCVDDYGNGFISWKEYNSRIDSVDCHLVFSDDDKNPKYLFYCDIMKQFLRRQRKGRRK